MKPKSMLFFVMAVAAVMMFFGVFKTLRSSSSDVCEKKVPLPLRCSVKLFSLGFVAEQSARSGLTVCFFQTC